MITLTFNDLQELKEFCKDLLGATSEEKETISVAPTQKQSPVPQNLTPAAQAFQSFPTPLDAPMTVTAPVTQQNRTPDPVPAPQPVQPQQPVQTTEKTYTVDELAVAAMPLLDSGKGPELQSILSNLGVQSLPELPPEKTGQFAMAIREMGARI